MILERINGHSDLLALTEPERRILCDEIRQFLIENVSRTGGHLAGNLGVVELSVAIETVYNTEKDRLVFDVGHQSYVHKLLTGRRQGFAGLRSFGGISGFPKPDESITDAFVAGHASSSVSIALGMARARKLVGQDYHVIAVLGDGAATGGMAFEGLNDAAVSGESLVVILNDNEMAIGKSVGGVSRHLSRLRSSENYLDAKRAYRAFVKKLPGGKALYNFSSRVKNRVKRLLLKTTIFENMGFTYLGPVDGHDVSGLISLLSTAKALNEPVLIHVLTKKGCGYSFAENDPAKFHGIGKFDPATGKKLGPKVTTYSDSFGQTVCQLAREDKRVCAITAAMPGGTGLLDFMKEFPDRLYDVGIAEEHAVSMAGGLAKQGAVPVVALYSTFLQRGYDQLLQDIGLLQLHAVFAVDRAGLVGDDGPTHHGVFDVGFLRQVPGMQILCPATLTEQQQMLRWAVTEATGPVAIRYSRGTQRINTDTVWHSPDDTVLCHRTGSDVTLLTYGDLIANVLEAADLLSESGICSTVLRLPEVSEPDLCAIAPLLRGPLVVCEEVSGGCGIRSDLCEAFGAERTVTGMDLGRRFIPHGNLTKLYELTGLDAHSIAELAKEALSHEN